MGETDLESDWSTTQYDWDAETLPSTAVVKTVAALTGQTPTALPPLYDHVDPDALDDLLGGHHGDTVEVAFSYTGVDVRVSSDGTIAIRPDE